MRSDRRYHTPRQARDWLVLAASRISRPPQPQSRSSNPALSWDVGIGATHGDDVRGAQVYKFDNRNDG